ncbi:hypothetical protein SAMN05216325_104113 [Nitrosomonas marina]|uniref:Uncharacterized protein n=1 Tax=Nitrosomonas marina TaxID=917 RepID=A0A1H8CDV2_9PROT|nr:hypothetical protein SAMN05216325_104113 [Nitrosomonas marina]
MLSGRKGDLWMLTPGSFAHQPNLFDTDLLLQRDPADLLLRLALEIPKHMGLMMHFPFIICNRQVR